MTVNALKKYGVSPFLIGASCLLVACQSLPTSEKNEAQCLPGELKQKEGCVVRRNKSSSTDQIKKKRYTATFKVDPHARHKQAARIVINDSPGSGKYSGGDKLGAEGRAEAKLEGQKTTKEFDNIAEKVATFSVNNSNYKFRNYAQSIVSPDEHAPRSVRYQEKEGYPRVRSGNLQFDGLFALANEEMRTRFISRTSDKHYQKAKSFACECYGDPKSPHFLASSHLALAGHLSLSMLTPERMKSSLLFQLSPYRNNLIKPVSVPGDKAGLQILQRANRHGAWPVYSSRILWSLAAHSVLTNLPDDERSEFSRTAYRAMKNTIEIDRDSIFDGRDGLYFGGHDLQQWPQDIQGVDLATVKSLTVNAIYFRALVFASDLAASQNDVATSVKYLDWALDLKNAINQHFWNAKLGVYRSFLTNKLVVSLDANVNHRSLWSGHFLWEQSLVLELGIADALQRARISEYAKNGSSPFGDAFSLRAAARQKNITVANRVYESLFQRASQKLTHMSAGVEAGDRRVDQDPLVSVSAYFSSVVDGVFGVKTSDKGISFNPFITAKLRREQFDSQRDIALYDVTFRGKQFDIKIILPKASSSSGYYDVAHIKVNGKQYGVSRTQNKGNTRGSKRLMDSTNNEIEWSALSQENTIIISLGKLKPGIQTVREFPQPPSAFSTKNASAPTSGVLAVPAAKGRKYVASWGAEGESLKLKNVSITVAGQYAIQWEYRMEGKHIQGIHNGVKRLRLIDANSNELVNKVVQFPIVSTRKRGNKKRQSGTWSLSSPVIVTLSPGTYRVDLDDFMNMSYLKANMTYTGIGGRNGAANRFDIKGLRITPL